MSRLEKISAIIEGKSELFIELSDKVWELAEVGFQEYKSAEVICSLLEQEGFVVEKGLAGIKTAFVGSYGNGHPVIGILGEFDALPGLHHERACTVRQEDHSIANGHGCGHNLLGAGALAAAVAVKEYMQASKIKGTVKYFGCPGEENGAGKTFMTREGCFKDVDIALCWHPSDTNGVWGMGTLVNLSAYFRFHGISAHAAATPHLGRSALDAVELMNVGVNYLREHIIPDARVHYAVTNTGGGAPNVVQDYAEVYYFVRAPKVNQAQVVYDRICDVAKGAALMTGTRVEIQFQQGVSDYLPNPVVGQVMHKNLVEVGPPNFDQVDLDLAERFRETMNPLEVKSSLAQVGLFLGADMVKKLEHKVLSDVIGPFIHLEKALPGSTDVGDVSYVVPTAQILVACNTIGTSPHTWQFTAQSASSIGNKGMLTAGKAMAMTAIDFLLQPELVEVAKAELMKKNDGVYDCPIPNHIKPDMIKA